MRSSMDEKRVDKADVIKYALDTNGISDKSKVIMIGDRLHDIIGAAKNGLPLSECCGATVHAKN